MLATFLQVFGIWVEECGLRCLCYSQICCFARALLSIYNFHCFTFQSLYVLLIAQCLILHFRIISFCFYTSSLLLLYLLAIIYIKNDLRKQLLPIACFLSRLYSESYFLITDCNSSCENSFIVSIENVTVPFYGCYSASSLF